MEKASNLVFVDSSVCAGFPSPAEGYTQDRINLNQLLVHNNAATFLVRVQGHSMRGAGIHHQDILIVDRSISVQNNYVVVAILNGEFTVKRFKQIGTQIFLVAEHPNFKPIQISENDDFSIWGVATYVIHQL